MLACKGQQIEKTVEIKKLYSLPDFLILLISGRDQ